MNAPPCVVCGGANWLTLPDAGPRSMASDWRVIDHPLTWSACARCGLARQRPPQPVDGSFYASGYTLYAHAPGSGTEQARQNEYAQWIAEAITAAPAQVFDIGCGNGSLLRALRACWPHAALLGCDPSADAVAYGRGEGLRLRQGTADDLPDDVQSDLVLAINVLEHTSDPKAFLVAMRGALSARGHALIVCPDGTKPGLDLLFSDHQFSFGREHLHALMRISGLQPVSWLPAPAALGAFQMVIARPAAAGPASPAVAPAIVESRRAYLERWRRLDRDLRLRISQSTVCFGAGEAAGLLRAYAPQTWSMVRACTTDGRPQGTFGPLPLISLDDVRQDDTVLVGVRPLDQARVAERLRARFSRVITWYDLVDAEARD